jgi:hypothetical protein
MPSKAAAAHTDAAPGKMAKKDKSGARAVDADGVLPDISVVFSRKPVINRDQVGLSIGARFHGTIKGDILSEWG